MSQGEGGEEGLGKNLGGGGKEEKAACRRAHISRKKCRQERKERDRLLRGSIGEGKGG